PGDDLREAEADNGCRRRMPQEAGNCQRLDALVSSLHGSRHSRPCVSLLASVGQSYQPPRLACAARVRILSSGRESHVIQYFGRSGGQTPRGPMNDRRDDEENRLSARAARYVRVGTNVGAVAARVAGQRLLGRNGDDAANAAALAAALGGLKGPIMKVAQL